MLRCCARLPLHMYAPLERQVIVGSHARETRDCPTHRLIVHKVQRITQPAQNLAEFGAEPRLARLHTRSRTALNLRQFEVSGYVADGLDAQLLQFLHRAGVDSWQE